MEQKQKRVQSLWMWSSRHHGHEEIPSKSSRSALIQCLLSNLSGHSLGEKQKSVFIMDFWKTLEAEKSLLKFRRGNEEYLNL